MAGASAIFRIAANGDTEATARTAKDIIEFDGGSVPDQTGSLVATDVRWKRDVNPHPNPRRALTKWQDSRLGVLEVTVAGYFTDKSNTIGPKLFHNWQVEANTNASLPVGRMGLRVDDFGDGVIDVVPTTSIGYLLHDAYVTAQETDRGSLGFIAKFYRNGATPSSFVIS